MPDLEKKQPSSSLNEKFHFRSNQINEKKSEIHHHHHNHNNNHHSIERKVNTHYHQSQSGMSFFLSHSNAGFSHQWKVHFLGFLVKRNFSPQFYPNNGVCVDQVFVSIYHDDVDFG